jgi:uncharacterized metal-binding protein YceD (DUF177 family)
MTPELFRPISLASIRASGLRVVVRATSEECAALAQRMDIPSIAALECTFDLTRDAAGDSIHASGQLRARVTRVCVVSAEDFEMTVHDDFKVRFVPAGEEKESPDPDLDDEIPYEGDIIELGNAATEQLGLVLPPYPRMEGATIPDIGDDADDTPFAVLSPKAGSENGQP